MPFDTIRPSEIFNYIGQNDVLIIDLRSFKSYQVGHIPNAINIPYEELVYRKDELDPNYTIIFYCEKGSVSLMAARDLMNEGFNIKSLYGGFRSYSGRVEKSH